MFSFNNIFGYDLLIEINSSHVFFLYAINYLKKKKKKKKKKKINIHN